MHKLVWTLTVIKEGLSFQYNSVKDNGKELPDHFLCSRMVYTSENWSKSKFVSPLILDPEAWIWRNRKEKEKEKHGYRKSSSSYAVVTHSMVSSYKEPANVSPCKNSLVITLQMQNSVEDPWFIYLLFYKPNNLWFWPTGSTCSSDMKGWIQRGNKMKMNTNIKNGLKPSTPKKCSTKVCIIGPCLGPIMYLWAEQAVGEGETPPWLWSSTIYVLYNRKTLITHRQTVNQLKTQPKL